MTRFLVPLLCALACALSLGACSNTGGTRRSVTAGADPAAPMRISFRDYRSGIRLTLVNDGYLHSLGVEGETFDLRRANFQSSRRSDPMTKVAPDALVAGVLEFLEDKGFREYATSGPAPPEGTRSSQLSTSLEVVDGGTSRTWLFDVGWLRATSPPRAYERYREARDVFLDVHREIEQFQSGTPEDWSFDGIKIRQKEWR